MHACMHAAYVPELYLKVAGYVRECATVEEAAERVVSEAFKARGLRDDITAAVGWLGTPPWVAELVERKAGRGRTDLCLDDEGHVLARVLVGV